MKAGTEPRGQLSGQQDVPLASFPAAEEVLDCLLHLLLATCTCPSTQAQE